MDIWFSLQLFLESYAQAYKYLAFSISYKESNKIYPQVG
jgi:hypothetical protein